MPHEDIKFERVAENDPRRCQSVHTNQQCPYKAMEGSKYCQRHRGVGQEAAKSKAKYLVALYQSRISEQANHPQVKDLSEEIGILRMTLEKRLQACGDDTTLLMFSSQITTLVREITICMEKWHRIEMSTNAVMDRAQALSFIQDIGDIIANELEKLQLGEGKSNALMKNISDRMIDSLGQRTNYSIRDGK